MATAPMRAGQTRPSQTTGHTDSFHLQALELEDERGSPGNAPIRETFAPIAFICGYLQLAHLPHLHAKATLVPPSDDPADAGLVGKGLLARIFGAPELRQRVSLLIEDLAQRVDRGLRPLDNFLAVPRCYDPLHRVDPLAWLPRHRADAQGLHTSQLRLRK